MCEERPFTESDMQAMVLSAEQVGDTKAAEFWKEELRKKGWEEYKAMWRDSEPHTL